MRRNIVLTVLIGSIMLFQSQVMAGGEGFYTNDHVGYWSFDLGYHQNFGSMVTAGAPGFFIETGFNLGKFFHKEAIVSIYAGLTTSGTTGYHSGFQQRVQDHYQLPQDYVDLTNRDTLLDPYTDEEMNHIQSYQMGESRMNVLMNGIPESDVGLYYGLMLRYPHKYAPVIKLYSIWNATDMGSVSKAGWYTVGSGTGRAARSIDRFGYGVEVMLFKGYTLIGDEKIGNVNIGYVSMFFEQYDFKETRIYMKNDDNERDIYLKEFVDSDFWSGYEKETRVGFKVGFQLL